MAIPKKYTKTELREMILKVSPDAKVSTKATLPALIEIYAGLTKTVENKPSGRRCGSSKVELRAAFNRKGRVTPADIEAIAKRFGVKSSSVLTGISDLKSERWAKGPVLKILRSGEDYVLSD